MNKIEGPLKIKKGNFMDVLKGKVEVKLPFSAENFVCSKDPGVKLKDQEFKIGNPKLAVSEKPVKRGRKRSK